MITFFPQESLILLFISFGLFQFEWCEHFGQMFCRMFWLFNEVLPITCTMVLMVSCSNQEPLAMSKLNYVCIHLILVFYSHGWLKPYVYGRDFCYQFQNAQFCTMNSSRTIAPSKSMTFLCNSARKLFSVIQYVWAKGRWNIDIHCYYGGSMVYTDGLSNSLFWVVYWYKSE